MELYISGFLYGLAVVVTPGAVTMQAIRNGLERGFRASLLVQVGALVGLTLWAGIGLIGAVLITDNVFVRLFLSMIGAMLLLWLTTQALRDAIRWHPQKAQQLNTRSDFMVGVLLSIANPLAIAFWLSIGSNEITSPTQIKAFVFFVGLMSSTVLWSLFLAGLTAWGQRMFTPLVFRIVNLLCGLALGFFAVRLVLDIMKMLLG